MQHQLAGYDYAAERGGAVIALTLPDSFRVRLNLRSGFVLDILNGWDRLMALPDADKLAMLRDPAGRAEMDRLAQSTEARRAIGNWAAYVLLETFTDEYRRFQGRTLRATSPASSGARRGTPWPTSRSPTGSRRSSPTRTGARTRPAGPGGSRSGEMVAPWSAPRMRAHLDMIDSFSFSTTLLAWAVRARAAPDRGGRPLPHGEPGPPGRPHRPRPAGHRRHADVVVFDPATIGPVRCTRGSTCRAGRAGSTAPEGISHVLVNGEPVVHQGELLDARPGTLLRSGRDTTTVTVAEAGGRRVAGRSAPAG